MTDGGRVRRSIPSADDVRSALGFLTIVGGDGGAPGPGAVPVFPLVGVLVGAGVGLTWWVVDLWWAAAVAAAAALTADLVLTGLLHVDGLADSGDGLLPPLPRDRRFAVMSDPHVGAFGVATVVAVLLVRFAALASAAPDPVAVAAIWAASRSVMAVTVCRGTHARADGGLGGGFRGAAVGAVVVVAAPCVLVPAAVAGVPALVAVAVTLAAAAGVVSFARARLGGWTGDVLGAAGVVSETAGLLVLAGQW